MRVIVSMPDRLVRSGILRHSIMRPHVLLGMGIREFSMPAPFIPRTKALLQHLDLKTARKAAREVLAMDDCTLIRSHLTRVLSRIEQHT